MVAYERLQLQEALEDLGATWVDQQRTNARQAGFDEIQLERIDEADHSAMQSRGIEIRLTVAIIGVRDDLPLDRVLTVFDRLQYVCDLALWVQDPYALRVRDLTSASRLRPRDAARAEPGYEPQISQLHYGSDPTMTLAMVGIILHALPKLLDALQPYVQAFTSLAPRKVRRARAGADEAIAQAERAEALLRKERADWQRWEEREARGREVRDRKEDNDLPTTFDGEAVREESKRLKIALEQMTHIELDLIEATNDAPNKYDYEY